MFCTSSILSDINNVIRKYQDYPDIVHMHTDKLEKGFQKKPIVAFTNSTVFILDFNI